MKNWIGRIRAVLSKQAALYFGLLVAVALLVVLLSAVTGDLAFGQVWVIGALCGGFFTVVACLYALGKLQGTAAEKTFDKQASRVELAAFSFTVGGPGLSSCLLTQPSVTGALVRKERFNYAA